MRILLLLKFLNNLHPIQYNGELNDEREGTNERVENLDRMRKARFYDGISLCKSKKNEFNKFLSSSLFSWGRQWWNEDVMMIIWWWRCWFQNRVEWRSFFKSLVCCFRLGLNLECGFTFQFSLCILLWLSKQSITLQTN